MLMTSVLELAFQVVWKLEIQVNPWNAGEEGGKEGSEEEGTKGGKKRERDEGREEGNREGKGMQEDR